MILKQNSDFTQEFRVVSPFAVNEEAKHITMMNKELLNSWVRNGSNSPMKYQ